MTDTPLVERRSEVRHRVFKGGTITFQGRGVDCTVRNMSGGGAALDVSDTAIVPRTFQLAIRTDNFNARCRVILNKGRRFGIAFD